MQMKCLKTNEQGKKSVGDCGVDDEGEKEEEPEEATRRGRGESIKK